MSLVFGLGPAFRPGQASVLGPNPSPVKSWGLGPGLLVESKYLVHQMAISEFKRIILCQCNNWGCLQNNLAYRAKLGNGLERNGSAGQWTPLKHWWMWINFGDESYYTWPLKAHRYNTTKKKKKLGDHLDVPRNLIDEAMNLFNTAVTIFITFKSSF